MSSKPRQDRSKKEDALEEYLSGNRGRDRDVQDGALLRIARAGFESLYKEHPLASEIFKKRLSKQVREHVKKCLLCKEDREGILKGRRKARER